MTSEIPSKIDELYNLTHLFDAAFRRLLNTESSEADPVVMVDNPDWYEEYHKQRGLLAKAIATAPHDVWLAVVDMLYDALKILYRAEHKLFADRECYEIAFGKYDRDYSYVRDALFHADNHETDVEEDDESEVSV